jgi:tRNA modification GTPase
VRVRDDTIVALATASGRGAVAMVRVSGADAERICRRVLAPWPARAREVTRCRIHAPDDPATLVDDALVTVFVAPASYTGETVVELSTHGGAYVPHAVCAVLVEAGARPAMAGEFTERAVLNGKLDLLRAEAIADLIDARSRASHRTALEQLSGGLSTRLHGLRDAIIELEALLAYDIDFPEEDGGRLERRRVAAACDTLLAQLDRLLATAPAAILGREGATVVFAGPPNAGKSSLLNALVGEARVIVSDEPGTTRDAVEVLLDHDPWPLRLVDTAGIREPESAAEQLGIEVGGRYLARAHVVIACADSEEGMRRATRAIAARTMAPIVGALTKRDLVAEGYKIEAGASPSVVPVSAVRHEGLDLLLARVTEAVAGTLGRADPDMPTITRARHRAALGRAREELGAFAAEWAGDALPAPVAAVRVRAAREALDELIGTVDVEDVFARVFSTFCVGK